MSFSTLLKSPLEEITFSVVDTETTGMNAKHCRIMDIAVVQVKNFKIIKKWTSLINPLQQVDPWISQYTKLTDQDVVNKKPFNNFHSYIGAMLKDTVFVAHNVGFDYAFVSSEFSRCSCKLIMPKICTVLLARKFLPQLKKVHLDALSDFYNIKIKQRHRALPDALATAYVLNEFIRIAQQNFNARTLFDLERLQRIRISKDALLDLKYEKTLFN